MYYKTGSGRTVMLGWTASSLSRWVKVAFLSSR